MKKRFVAFVAVIIVISCIGAVLFPTQHVAYAAAYTAISPLHVPRIVQPEGLSNCFMASIASIEAYMLGSYSYDGLSRTYTWGTDYNIWDDATIAAHNYTNGTYIDPVYKHYKTLNGNNVDTVYDATLSKLPVPMTKVNGAPSLDTIYNLLKQGYPVAVYTNAPHASVIISYNHNSDTLTTSGFTIMEINYNWRNSIDYYNRYAANPTTIHQGNGGICYTTLAAWIADEGSITSYVYPSSGTSPLYNPEIFDPVVFNAEFYKDANSDLSSMSESELRNHWMMYGVDEGRCASPVFNAPYYLNTYSDLKDAFGTNYREAIRHFVNHGIAEGRKAHEWFDVNIYKANYYDLQVAFGSDNYQYYQHFVNSGYYKYENRLATARFKLIFDANGGTCTTAQKGITKFASYGALPGESETVRDGYIFTGWFTSIDGGTEVTDSTQHLSDNETTIVYAHWAEAATVTFDPNGGSVSNSTESIKSGDVLGWYEVPTRSGYIFDGWYTSASGGTRYNCYTTISSSVTLYAHWVTAETIQPAASMVYGNSVYALYEQNMSWTSAKDLCETLGGHLVTITSAEEQSQVVNLIQRGVNGGYSIGYSDADTEGVWTWVTGEESTFTNWDSESGEPNGGTSENYCMIVNIDNPPNKQTGEWNDTISITLAESFWNVSNIGFVCEFSNEISAIDFEFSDIEMKRGETLIPGMAILPETAERANLTWVSDNPAIASVDEVGAITALSIGCTNITASSPDGRISDKLTVAVQPNIDASSKFIADGICVDYYFSSLGRPFSIGGPLEEYSRESMVCMVREPGDEIRCEAALTFTNDRDEYIATYELTEGNLSPAGSDTFVVSKKTDRKNVITVHIYDVSEDGSQGPEMATANMVVFVVNSEGTLTLPANLRRIEANALDGTAATIIRLPNYVTLEDNSLAGIPVGTIIYFNSDTITPYIDSYALGVEEYRNPNYFWIDTGTPTMAYFNGDGCATNYYCLGTEK